MNHFGSFVALTWYCILREESKLVTSEYLCMYSNIPVDKSSVLYCHVATQQYPICTIYRRFPSPEAAVVEHSLYTSYVREADMHIVRSMPLYYLCQ